MYKHTVMYAHNRSQTSMHMLTGHTSGSLNYFDSVLYMHVCMFVCMYVYIRVFVQVHMCMCMYVDTYRTYACVYAYARMYERVCIHTYV